MPASSLWRSTWRGPDPKPPQTRGAEWPLRCLDQKASIHQYGEPNDLNTKALSHQHGLPNYLDPKMLQTWSCVVSGAITEHSLNVDRIVDIVFLLSLLLSESLSLSLSLYLLFGCSCQVSSSLWSNVSKSVFGTIKIEVVIFWPQFILIQLDCALSGAAGLYVDLLWSQIKTKSS